MGQGHFTFNREVISSLINPELLNTNAISADAKDRAQQLRFGLQNPMGAYANCSKGRLNVR